MARVKHTVPRVIYRWFSGRSLDGYRRTDATAFRAGTKNLTATPLHGWSYWPGWKRSAVRNGATLATLVVVYAWFFHRPVLLGVFGVFVASVAAWALRTAYVKWQHWELNRRYVKPLHVALTPALALPENVRPADYIQVPRAWATDKRSHPVVVTMPASWDASVENEARIGGLIMQKLDVSLGTHTWLTDTVGTPQMTIKWEPTPPELVSVTDPDIREAIDQAGPSEFVLGRSASVIYRHNFADESPHAGFSCESGTGKSSLLQVLAAQCVRKHPDNRVVGLDPKQASLVPVAGLPNVAIHTDAIGAEIEEMWAAVHDIRLEVERRGKALKEDLTVTFPMLLCLIDEINYLATLTKSHWAKVKGPGDPKLAPFWDDLLIILAAGRQFRIHLVIVGQDLREQALGNIGLRTMIGLRGIAGYDAAMWTRFIQTRPIPRVPREVGRWYYQVRGDRRLVQNAYGTPQEIVDLGRGDRPMSQVPLSLHVEATQGGTGDSDQGQQESDQEKALVIGQKAAADYLGIEVEAFRKRRARAELVPLRKQGNQPVFSTDQLDSLRIEAK